MNKSERNLNKIKEEKLTVMGGSELKNLNIEPLSIAKFFYEKGAKNIAIIQRLIYLSFLKVLEEENSLLFTEGWQAWLGGPVVESVFNAMSDHLDKHGCDYEELFSNFPHLKDEKVLQHLKEIYDDYQNYKRDKKEYDFFEKALNKPWQLARHKLTDEDELDYQRMELSDILDYINQEKTQHKVIQENEENSLWLFGLDEEIPNTSFFSVFPAIYNYSAIEPKAESGNFIFSFN